MKKPFAVLVAVSGMLAASFLEGAAQSRAQTGPSLALRLGYSETDRLLIVHADDVGIAHSVNTAAFRALATGQVTSASVMATCPWLPEVGAYAKNHPEADLGLHLTLSSEWDSYKWGPAASENDVPSLVDPLGYFHTIRRALAGIDASEAEIELRAQIRRARESGLQLTHLDSHQLLVFFRPELFQVYLKMGREVRIPILLSRSIFDLIRTGMRGAAPDWESLLRPEDILIDQVLSISPEESLTGWPAYYRKAIEGLRPGVNQLIVHLGTDGDELRGMAGDAPFGASWRQNEFDYLTGTEFGELLRREKVKLITWRQIAQLAGK